MTDKFTAAMAAQYGMADDYDAVIRGDLEPVRADGSNLRRSPTELPLTADPFGTPASIAAERESVRFAKQRGRKPRGQPMMDHNHSVVVQNRLFTPLFDRAVIVPAHNEEATIEQTITEIHAHLPEAVVVVVCNACEDSTYTLAREKLSALADTCTYVLLHEPRRGKARALRAGMSAVNARAYAWIDADLTYPFSSLESMFYMVEEKGIDMVCGDRITGGGYAAQNTRQGHSLGNQMVARMLRSLFPSETRLKDPLTGLRVMNSSVVDGYALTCTGFEVEVDISAFCLDHGMMVTETPIDYYSRPTGSVSKLNTWKDGWRVGKNMVKLCRHYRPMQFFSILAGTFFLLGLMAGVPPVMDYINSQYVYRVPLAILATGLELVAFILFCCGLVLDSMADTSKRNIERDFARSKRLGGRIHQPAAATEPQP